VIQRNFHQEFIGLLELATGSLALVLPLTILHLCGAQTALADTLLFISFSVSSYTVSDRVIRLFCQSHWSRDLNRGFTAGRFLEMWVRIPPRAQKYVSCECCVLSDRVLRDGLNHSSRDVLPNVVCLSVIVKPRQLGAPGPQGLSMHGKKKFLYTMCMQVFSRSPKQVQRGGGSTAPNHSKPNVSGFGRSLPRPWPLHPRERPSTHCTGGWVAIGMAWTASKKKSRLPLGFDPRTAQPIISSYAD
jgi:hypothetical protein